MQTADHILEASSREPDELKGSRPVRRGEVWKSAR